MGVDRGYGVPKPKKTNATAKPKVNPISADKLNEKFRDKEWRLARYERTDKGIWTLRQGRSAGRLPEKVTRVDSRQGGPYNSGGAQSLRGSLQTVAGKGPNRRYVAYSNPKAAKY